MAYPFYSIPGFEILSQRYKVRIVGRPRRFMAGPVFAQDDTDRQLLSPKCKNGHPKGCPFFHIQFHSTLSQPTAVLALPL